MKKTYMDRYIACPYYTREESNVAKKIHCEGCTEGTHLHICFDRKDLKKLHKKNLCKNENGFMKCPLYSIIAKKYREKV